MRHSRLLGLALAALAISTAPFVEARSSRTALRIDLADTAAGVYHGDVISDARGSSKSNVTISVDKVAPGTVRITSDYERLPEFTTQLTRAMNSIQNTGNTPDLQVFLLDLSKNPRTLMITVDDASWGGVKQ